MATDKNSILFVRAKLKDDYFFNGIQKSGYKIVTPYGGNSLVPRLFREVWFRAHLPGVTLWYNKALKKPISENTVIIFDPLITPKFVKWLTDRCQGKRLIFLYEDRVERVISPKDIPDNWEKCSYDPDDCATWNMRQYGTGYQDIYTIKNKENPIYDAVYVGRDKGRAEYLLDVQKQLEAAGLKTYFHICADRQYFQKQKSFYKPLLRYEDYLAYVAKSRAILNIVPEGQRAITMRELECIYNSIKGITNNKGIKEWEHYDESRFFILGEDPIEKIGEFFEMPFKKVDEGELKAGAFDATIDVLMEG